MSPNETRKLRTKYLKVFFLVIIVLFLIFLILLPKMKQFPSETIEYKIYNAGESSQSIFNYTKLTVKNIDLAHERAIISIIPLNYGKYDFDITSDGGKENFRLFYHGMNNSFRDKTILNNYNDLNSKTYNSEENPWIKEIIIKNGVLGIFYNNSLTKKKEIKEVSLYGLILTNKNENDFYYDKSSLGISCQEKNFCRNRYQFIITWVCRWRWMTHYYLT